MWGEKENIVKNDRISIDLKCRERDSLIKKWSDWKTRGIFYKSKKWRRLRGRVVKLYGPICMKCESKKNINVDHVKPFKYNPWLRLRIENLQVLCGDCNKKKLNNTEDYRSELHYSKLRELGINRKDFLMQKNINKRKNNRELKRLNKIAEKERSLKESMRTKTVLRKKCGDVSITSKMSKRFIRQTIS